MTITASVVSQPITAAVSGGGAITANVGSSTVSAAASGGIGPQGPAGTAGVAHAASHSTGGSDAITAASIGAMSVTGDSTMTGVLTVQPAVAPAAPDGSLRVIGDNTYANIAIQRHSDINAHPSLRFNRTRGTKAAQTVAQSGDSLGAVAWHGVSAEGAEVIGGSLVLVCTAAPEAGDTFLRTQMNIFVGAGTSTAQVASFTPTTSTFHNTLMVGGTAVVVSSDSRLSDARTPTAHKASHAVGGTDALSPADIGAVPSAGGTLTGNLTHAATQTFVSALGSAASPAYTFTGDTNTGVYSPSADQWAVSTGGVKRLRVDHVGDVYVGEGNLTSGLRYLDVINMDTASSSGSIVRLITLNSDGTAGAPANLVKYKNGHFSIWNGETDPAAFTSFTVGSSEIMRLSSTGVVGVGANVPALSSGAGIHCAGSTFRLGTARTPSSSTATGNTGEICWDTSYVYLCVNTNTWRRIAHSTW